MLIWMEQHRLPFACTTNVPDRLDRASLRRFLVKVRFDRLTQVQARSAFQRFFGQPAPIALGALRTPGRCAWCGKAESPGAVVLPFGTEPGTHTWLHAECWPGWYQARQTDATAALGAMSIRAKGCCNEQEDVDCRQEPYEGLGQ
jgi:hypothetical protein